MPLAGKGMLLTSMDIDASDEAEFNRWYDREHLEERVAIDGIISMHLIEKDPVFSRPLSDDPLVSDPGAGDWFVLMDGTHVNAVSAALAARIGTNAAFKSAVISTGVYNLMWDLAKSDLSAA